MYGAWCSHVLASRVKESLAYFFCERRIGPTLTRSLFRCKLCMIAHACISKFEIARERESFNLAVEH